MSKPRPPKPAKLVISCFTKDKKVFGEVAQRLTEFFGQPDVVSPWLAFEHTDYYKPEMGAPLFRRLMAYHELMEQEGLPDVKLVTNELEDKFATDRKRLVNIDPGYLLAERFVLATGKNYTHRIYLKGGIYGDLTLVYYNGGFHALDWTYPDYAGERIVSFLQCVRDRYIYQMKFLQVR
jgi:hypothetical protein